MLNQLTHGCATSENATREADGALPKSPERGVLFSD